jgi:pilus assembly protein Flp/PilA
MNFYDVAATVTPVDCGRTRPPVRVRRLSAGVTTIEYALIAALLAVFIVGSVSLVGQSVVALYVDVANKVASVVAGN